MKNMKKGFTLIELLIVIAILAILTTVLVLVINPAELFRQARDSQRMNDIAIVNKAVSYYLSTATSPALVAGPRVTAGTACGFASGCPVASATNVYAIDNTGWVGANFTLATGGSPIAKLPQDPTNSGNYYYAYKGDATTLVYELNARLESTKFRDQMVNDGGSANTCSTYIENTCWYEVGTSLTL